jgi:hypothetical protein
LHIFGNRGIAHLTPEKMLKSITLVELRRPIKIISRLATTLQHLCQYRPHFIRTFGPSGCIASLQKGRSSPDYCGAAVRNPSPSGFTSGMIGAMIGPCPSSPAAAM